MSAVRLLASLLPIISSGWNVAAAQDEAVPAFEHLRRDGSTLIVQHSLESRFSASPAFSVHGPTHRSASFNEVPFEISLSAFITEQAAIMVHAERVADLSGASNYDRFAPSDWPLAGYRSPGTSCQSVPAAVVAEEHDLLWLRERGFEPSGDIWIDQHFLSGNDHNDEIVVSLLYKGPSCDDEAVAERQRNVLREALQVSR